MQCGAILTAPTGQIMAADRNSNGWYDLNLHCVWAIVAPEQTGIKFDFGRVDIREGDYPNCVFDYLEVFSCGSRTVFNFIT